MFKKKNINNYGETRHFHLSALSSALVGTRGSTQPSLESSVDGDVCLFLKTPKKRETARYVFKSARPSTECMAIVSDMLQNIRFFHIITIIHILLVK